MIIKGDSAGVTLTLSCAVDTTVTAAKAFSAYWEDLNRRTV